MSRTIVFQSYRAENVAPVITRCMGTVRDWAEQKGYDYRFYDDEFLRKAPSWLSDATKDMLLTTDYARILTARELHGEGYDRSIWIDADVAIFAPSQLNLPEQTGFGFCREWWFEADGEEYALRKRINNCFCWFDKSDAFVPYYLQAMEGKLTQKGAKITSWEFSTVPLTRLYKGFPFPLVSSVVTLSPTMRKLVLRGNKLAVAEQMKVHNTPIHAVHLAFSADNTEGEAILDLAMERRWPFDGSF